MPGLSSLEPLAGVMPPSFVYFIGNAERVKIGVTYRLQQRLNGLRNSCPTPLTLLAYTPGDVWIEQAYHWRFAAARLHGEWFTRTDEINSVIDRLRAEIMHP
jgi:Meiotically up-regulated gene 113